MQYNIATYHNTHHHILRTAETSAMENKVFNSKIWSDQVGSRYKGPMCPIWVVCAEASGSDKWHCDIVLGSWKSSYDSSTHRYWKTSKEELDCAGLLIPGSLRICACNMYIYIYIPWPSKPLKFVGFATKTEVRPAKPGFAVKTRVFLKTRVFTPYPFPCTNWNLRVFSDYPWFPCHETEIRNPLGLKLQIRSNGWKEKNSSTSMPPSHPKKKGLQGQMSILLSRSEIVFQKFILHGW